MCGIFGSTTFEQFSELYSANKQRGNFAHGFYFVRKAGWDKYMRKGPGEYDLDNEYEWDDPGSYDKYLGHTQAPTSANREFKPSTSHPFSNDRFTVAHNGVLENHDALSKEYFGDTVKVDSEIIPRLLSRLYTGDDIRVIQKVCKMLKGIFSCWIYNDSTSQVYVVRSGSTLYTDPDNQTFSSVKTNTATKSLDEGVIYCLSPEGLAKAGKFKSSTPFFM